MLPSMFPVFDLHLSLVFCLKCFSWFPPCDNFPFSFPLELILQRSEKICCPTRQAISVMTQFSCRSRISHMIFTTKVIGSKTFCGSMSKNSRIRLSNSRICTSGGSCGRRKTAIEMKGNAFG